MENFYPVSVNLKSEALAEIREFFIGFTFMTRQIYKFPTDCFEDTPAK